MKFKLKILLSCTLDDASNNNVCVDILKGQSNDLVLQDILFYIRCPYIFNLIVNAGLKLVKSTVKKVRFSVNYIKFSPGRHDKFVRLFAQFNKNIEGST